MPGYPIVLDLTGRLVVVVGLGKVGRRKAAGLVEAGAMVRGVDPKGWNGDLLPGLIELREDYCEGHLEGAFIVFAAASAEVNRRVVADASRRGQLVNSASEPGSGDFAVPAIWRSGPIVLSISTSGAGPALASALRDRVSEAIGPSVGTFAALLVELRPMVLERISDEETRRMLFRDWADPRWLDRWRTLGPEGVRSELLDMIEHVADDQGSPQPPADQ